MSVLFSFWTAEQGRLIDQEGVRRRRLHFPPRPDIPRPPPQKQISYTKLLYFPPALFDVTHVLLVYFGIQLTYPSSFIMLKGLFKLYFKNLLNAYNLYFLYIYIAFLSQDFTHFYWRAGWMLFKPKVFFPKLIPCLAFFD